MTEYNNSWQPVGMYALKLRRMTGRNIKSGNFVKLRNDWTQVPLRKKEDIWDALMEYFYIPPEMNMAAIKKDVFLDMGSKFRDWRHSVKKPLKIKDDDTPEIVRARMTPDFIDRHDPLDIDVLLEKWCTKKNKDYAKHMKELRALHNAPHCSGGKSYARITHEDAVATGIPPTRAQNYVKTHKKLDETSK